MGGPIHLCRIRQLRSISYCDKAVRPSSSSQSTSMCESRRFRRPTGPRAQRPTASGPRTTQRDRHCPSQQSVSSRLMSWRAAKPRRTPSGDDGIPMESKWSTSASSGRSALIASAMEFLPERDLPPQDRADFAQRTAASSESAGGKVSPGDPTFVRVHLRCPLDSPGL
jgi:hypothetical protein